MVKINTHEMIDFYKKFDSVYFKYLKDKEKELGEKYIEEYSKLEEIELAYQFTGLTKIEYGDILTDLDMIYAKKEQSDQIVVLFDLIRNKIINQYINIEGLERLFSEKYIDFEWDMHLGIDYKKHKMKFYRDHFVHQIRNAYCMHVLLEKFGWREKIEKVLREENNSKISQFVYKYIEQQKICGCNVLGTMSEYNNDDFYYKNVIYMASYMAAIFHDIGYPEAANTVNQRRITEYIANLYNAESTGYDYVRLNALLQNSLLFRIVSFEEIKKRLSGDKPDHGALSSVIFLLNFYENGAIHSLQPYKKCAVELAALAIYNHTNQYCYDTSCGEGKYVRCLFILNPISYLLRLSDDMQEWDRIYFELSDKSNLILCNTCKTPIIRKMIQDKNSDYKEKYTKYYYTCNCNYINSERIEDIVEKAVFKPIFEYSRNFPYRRIYNVSVCENLKIEKLCKDDGEKEILCFSLDYELDKLLHVAYMNVEYAKYRIKELNQLKFLLDLQKELPQMKLKYFMTANPILIKTQIIKRYFESQEKKGFIIKDELDNLFELYKKIGEKGSDKYIKEYSIWENAFDEILNKLQVNMESIILEIYPLSDEYIIIKNSVKMSVDLYLQLLIFMEMHKRCNQFKCNSTHLDQKACVEWREIKNQSREVKELIRDSWQQFKFMYLDICKFESNPKGYYKQFEMTEYTLGCIARFVSAKNYVPVLKNKEPRIDAYTDLGIIQLLLDVG